MAEILLYVVEIYKKCSWNMSRGGWKLFQWGLNMRRWGWKMSGCGWNMSGCSLEDIHKIYSRLNAVPKKMAVASQKLCLKSR